MQIDTKEINLSVKRYLAGLGFPEHALKTDVRTGSGQVDLVVFDDDKPLVVVEYKSAENLPTADDKTELRFHPFVRQLQSYAAALKALTIFSPMASRSFGSRRMIPDVRIC